jgi:hypothetical protein
MVGVGYVGGEYIRLFDEQLFLGVIGDWCRRVLVFNY